MPADRSSERLWVVVRVDLFQAPLDPADPRTMITLREALPTKSEADQEADRLNDLAANRGIEVVYFSAPVKWFPDGRNVEIGY